MNILEWVAEEKIQKAIQEGAFDHLPGKGKPLVLDENPYEDASWRMASKLLKNQGFDLPWIEMRKDIQAELETARKSIQSAWLIGSNYPATAWEESEFQLALQQFRSRLEQINRHIFIYNLEVPRSVFQLNVIAIEEELNRVRSAKQETN